MQTLLVDGIEVIIRCDGDELTNRLAGLFSGLYQAAIRTPQGATDPSVKLCGASIAGSVAPSGAGVAAG